MVSLNEECTIKLSVIGLSQESVTIKILRSTSISDLYKIAAEKFELIAVEFDIYYKSPNNGSQLINLNESKEKSLTDLAIYAPIDEDYYCELTVVVPTSTSNNDAQGCSIDTCDDDELYSDNSASPAGDDAGNADESNGKQRRLKRWERRKGVQLQYTTIVESPNYVGLVNQAMTCYLNSLLQALFMTPEFRNALYNWEFDGVYESKSIPYQLQKLFLNLQTSSKSAVETTDLTISFGWQGSDAWHQHDIQELCRVMFDALEQKFKDTKQANLINDLYEGKMLDYVKCLECGTEKSREDSFLDIPLPVRPFGSTVVYNSIEEALRAFVQPEILDGSNQYFCEKCNRKCNAHKGLKFTKFPYLLTLHLKRFDFDYNTMHRIKLNDKVTFPEILNLNSFILPEKIENDVPPADNEVTIKYDDCSTTDSGSADNEFSMGTENLLYKVNGHEDNCSDEGIDVSGNDVLGPYVYELFSIMIHSGSASGGHYYAYVKDFSQNNVWICFNDQSVSPVTEEDIKKSYGGGQQRSYYSGAFSSSTNAYMLMYRQIDPQRNAQAMSVAEFPPHIKKLLQNMRQQEEDELLNKRKEDDLVKIDIICYPPNSLLPQRLKLPVYLDSSIGAICEFAYSRLRFQNTIDVNDCRLVLYNKQFKCIDCSFESDDIRLCDLFKSEKSSCCTDWMLEIRKPGTEWQQYKKGGITVTIFLIDFEKEDIKDSMLVRVEYLETLSMLKQKLGLALTTDPANIKINLDDVRYNENTDVISFNQNCRDPKLFVLELPDRGSETLKKADGIFKKIEKTCSDAITLFISLPIVTKDQMELLSIPPVSQDINQNFDKIEQPPAEGLSNTPNFRVSPQLGVATGITAPTINGTNGLLIGDGFDQSNSEDSSLSDSDRTLVGDAPATYGACPLVNSGVATPADQHMTSPIDPSQDRYTYDVLADQGNGMHWDDADSEVNISLVDIYSKFAQQAISPGSYFRVLKTLNYGTNSFDIFMILIDKGMTLELLKKHLEPLLKIPSDYFKVFKDIGYDQLSELTRPKDSFRVFRNGDVLMVNLGRVLKENEIDCKVYLLKPDQMEQNNFLCEVVITENQTVGALKKDILNLIKKKDNIEISFNRCRLREKGWKKPKKVYLDDQKFGEEIVIARSFELYLQELPEADTVTSNNQMVIFLRRWNPSTLTLGPFQEAVLDVMTTAEFRTKVSEMSGIPIEFLSTAYVAGEFPYDVHLLEIDANLDWGMTMPKIEDGCMFFYKDNREQSKQLTADEKKEIKQKEDGKLGKLSYKTYSPNKEKPLKIYLLDSNPTKMDELIQ